MKFGESDLEKYTEEFGKYITEHQDELAQLANDEMAREPIVDQRSFPVIDTTQKGFPGGII